MAAYQVSKTARSERTAASGMLRAIVWGGLLAGIADAAYATLYFGWQGASPVRIWQSVAAGLLGRETARAGGLPTASLGLALHFFIAFTAAAIYVVASRKLPVLVQQAWLFGSAYGLAVYFFMREVVIPLSAIGPRTGSTPPMTFWTGLAIHVLGVGLPIALCARRAALRERGAA